MNIKNIIASLLTIVAIYTFIFLPYTIGKDIISPILKITGIPQFPLGYWLLGLLSLMGLYIKIIFIHTIYKGIRDWLSEEDRLWQPK